MIYAKIREYTQNVSIDGKTRYALQFFGDPKQEEREMDNWAKDVEKKRQIFQDAENGFDNIFNTTFDGDGQIVSVDFLLNWLSKNNFIPVSETFFYKA